MDTPNAKQWVDFENGLVDRIIFSDPDIYKMEMERIFARAWCFVCHESQIPRVGDFFANYIGEDRVLAVRDKSGAISVLLNTCRHRGNAVCRAEQGNAKVFTCPYHGWSYGLDGELVGVPGLRDFYRNGLDKKDWGLARAAHVTSYRGLVFASLDPAAVPLEEYLGEVGRIGLDFIAERGDIEDGRRRAEERRGVQLEARGRQPVRLVSPGGVAPLRDPVGRLPQTQDEEAAFAPMSQMVMLGEYGHGIGGPMLSRRAHGGGARAPRRSRSRVAARATLRRAVALPSAGARGAAADTGSGRADTRASSPTRGSR
jgi:3-phenylpropionate/trans-cinnamate dioxygenase alpha subunit